VDEVRELYLIALGHPFHLGSEARKDIQDILISTLLFFILLLVEAILHLHIAD
jgi:hypothetical protein